MNLDKGSLILFGVLTNFYIIIELAMLNGDTILATYDELLGKYPYGLIVQLYLYSFIALFSIFSLALFLIVVVTTILNVFILMFTF